MADAVGWSGELSISSQGALRWAAAVVTIRGRVSEAASKEEAGSIAIDAFDVLIGLLIQHGDDSEPRDLFRHFGISIGEVVGLDGIDAGELQPAYDATTGDLADLPLAVDVRSMLTYHDYATGSGVPAA